MKRTYEMNAKQLQDRLNDADTNSLKGGKAQIVSLEQRTRELERELDLEQTKVGECFKNQKKLERKLKEVVFASEEDKKNLIRLQDLVDKLQVKVKTYRLVTSTHYT